MDERSALAYLADLLPLAGDDAAVIDGLVVTTDLLHETTDFPTGTTHYTAGWRAIGASFSDVAAMGGEAIASVAAYAAPEFAENELEAFISGANDVSTSVDAEYVGGDLDHLSELTIASTAIGRTESPVYRSGASPGERICVTGTLGRTAAALELFERGDTDAANELFRFPPRVNAGQVLASDAGAMIDSSDGVARSVHQLARASDCGFSLDGDTIPIDDRLSEIAPDQETAFAQSLFFGEDYELLVTLPPEGIDRIRGELEVALTPIGEVTTGSVLLDETPLPDKGYIHRQSDLD